MGNATIKNRALVEWCEDYELGIPAIDCQHRVLVDCLNRLWDATVRHAPASELLGCVNELEVYVRCHFREEEEGMRQSSYPEYEAHEKAHQRFSERVFRERVNIQADGYVTLDLIRFLHHWLLNHINVEDRHYADHAKAMATPPSLFARFLDRLQRRSA